jgi:hypothetical protein
VTLNGRAVARHIFEYFHSRSHRESVELLFAEEEYRNLASTGACLGRPLAAFLVVKPSSARGWGGDGFSAA